MEFLALYNDKGELIEEKINRKDKLSIQDGKYFRIAIMFIRNSNNEFLIQKTSLNRDNEFATIGGHVKYGNSSLQTILEEIKEELGINISLQEISLVKTNKMPKVYQDVYYLQKDIDINELTLQKEEVDYVKWMSIDEIIDLINSNQFRKSNINPFYDILKLI